MTTRDYFEQLAKMRAKFMEELAGDTPLPDFLRPENQTVGAELDEHSKRIREAVLRGDFETVRETLPELSVSGFNRSDDENDDVDGLDEARRNVDERIDAKEKRGEEDGANEDRGDRAP